MNPVALTILTLVGTGLLLVGLYAYYNQLPLLAWASTPLVCLGSFLALGGLGTGVVHAIASHHASSQRTITQLVDRKAEQNRYHDEVLAQLATKHGLRPLSAAQTQIPSADNTTAQDVLLESQDALFRCVLNTRTGPASLTVHCTPYQPASR